MLTAGLTNILRHDNRGDRPSKVLLMAARSEEGVMNHPSLLHMMRWRNGALSRSDLAHEPGL